MEQIRVSETSFTTQKIDRSELVVWYEQAFPLVARLVRNVGGSLDDAKDIFHDSLIIFWENRMTKRGEICHSEIAYILGIAKNLMIGKFNQSKKLPTVSLTLHEFAIPDDYCPTISQKRLLRLLEVSGSRCMDLLRAFYCQLKSVKEVARDFSYANEHSASVQKYKCLEKIKQVIKNKSMNYEDFME